MIYTPTANTIMHHCEEELYNKISENKTTTKLIEHQLYTCPVVETRPHLACRAFKVEQDQA
jgi:hypothetical protein